MTVNQDIFGAVGLVGIGLAIAVLTWRWVAGARPSPKIRPPKDGLGSRPWKSGGL